MRNTNIVHHVTYKHMKMNSRRTVLSAAGIALMVMLLTCVLIGKDTAYRYFVDLASMKNGAYHFAVYNIDKEKLDELKALDTVKEIGVTEDLKYTEFAQSGNPSRPFLNIRRYSPEAMEWMGIKVLEGRLPGNSNEIVISETAIDEGAAVKIGDRINAAAFTRSIKNNSQGDTVIAFPTLVLPAGETTELPYNMFYFEPGDRFYEMHEEIHEMTGYSAELEVVGIISRPAFEEPGVAWYAAISSVDEATLESPVFNALIMTDENKLDNDFYLKLRDIVGYENFYANEGVLIFAGSSSKNSLNFIVNAAEVFFVVLIAMISVMLIYNIFALSYDERARYLGMLSSVGATGKQKRSSVYFEAFTLLLPSLPAGFILGLVVVRLASRLAAPLAQKLFVFDAGQMTDFTPVLDVRPLTVIAVILLSIVTVFISALIPARKISKVGPIESIRGTKKSRKHKMTGRSDRLIKSPCEVMLSSRFLKNDKSKSFGIIRAVSIFFLVTVVVYFGASLLIMMVDYKLKDNGIQFAYSDRSDYSLVIESDYSAAEVESIKYSLTAIKGVSDIFMVRREMTGVYIPKDDLSEEYWNALYDIVSLYYPEGTYSREDFNGFYRGEDEPELPIGVVAFEDEEFARLAKDANALSYGEEDMPCILLNTAFISTDTYSIYGQKARDYRYIEITDPFVPGKGDTLPIRSMSLTRSEAVEKGYDTEEMVFPEIELDAPADLKVIAKVKPEEIRNYISGETDTGFYMIVPMSVADFIDKINCSRLATAFFFKCDNEAGIERLKAEVTRMDSQKGGIFLLPTSTGAASYNETMAYLIRIVLIIFTVIASAICLLNVYSSISALMASRRKHFAVLRSMGSTFSQLIKTGLLESCGMLIKSVIVAVPLTAVICLWLSRTLIEQFGYFEVTFPWVQSLMLIAFIVLAVLVMTAACLKRENKIDIIEEIKRESV